MPTGKIKWYDTEKGFGFITRDDGPDVFMHSSALPAGVAELKSGQRVEFGVAAGKRGDTAIGVKLLETRPSVEAAVAARDRKPAEDMVVIVEDVMKLLDGMSETFRRGKYPDKVTSRKLAGVLRAVADQLES
ncbi:cold-shock protein [Catenulispora sp. NF23]|uniref:Cold-shock protein n=1 Tax=Catenulispora pinistramenti TaxID=2705254 RepID=A0ABS5KUX8_9ACTN|nr:cold-shock protein [Catenulispora pinistramenti]MBS2549845.1 cold-shock protein [Catenulispora pinistramenti]